MRYGWDCIWYAVQWKWHQALCQFLSDHQEGEKVPIPTKNSSRGHESSKSV